VILLVTTLTLWRCADWLYPCKRRHSRWKMSQELKWKIISLLPDYTHAKMAGRKRERYTCKIEPRISVPFMLELEYKSKIIKKLLVIKEICSWLHTVRPSNSGGSQKVQLVHRQPSTVHLIQYHLGCWSRLRRRSLQFWHHCATRHSQTPDFRCRRSMHWYPPDSRSPTWIPTI